MLREGFKKWKAQRGVIRWGREEQEGSRHEAVAIEVMRAVHRTTPAALIAIAQRGAIGVVNVLALAPFTTPPLEVIGRLWR